MLVVQSAFYAALFMGIALFLWQAVGPSWEISRVRILGHLVPTPWFFAAFSIVIFVGCTTLIWLLLRRSVP